MGTVTSPGRKRVDVISWRSERWEVSASHQGLARGGGGRCSGAADPGSEYNWRQNGRKNLIFLIKKIIYALNKF